MNAPNIIGALPDATLIGCDGYSLWAGRFIPARIDDAGDVVASSVEWTQLDGWSSPVDLYAEPAGGATG